MAQKISPDRMSELIVFDMKVVIVDFYDSFVFNIASEFYRKGIASKVINYLDFNLLNKYWDQPETLILLGPGPGHPDDYENFLDYIRSKSPRLLTGICLGHQMLLRLLNMQVSASRNIKHGMTELIDLNQFIPGEKELAVQRYNSLCVHVDQLKHIGHDKLFACNQEGEILAFQSKNILSYQFHPESIGTSCRTKMFESLITFFYNRRYDKNQNFWDFKTF
jgi:anthranilate/para-aminobenzoate synthase component II